MALVEQNPTDDPESSARLDVIGQFDRAAGTYHAASDVQRRVAHCLAEILDERTKPVPENILEIGCGTGHLTQTLLQRWSGAKILATDASHEMIDTARQQMTDLPSQQLDRLQFQRLVAGSERLTGNFDSIVSSLTFQWIDNLPGLINELARHSSRIAFSIPIDGSFVQWIAAHRRAGLDAGTRRLFSESELAAEMDRCPNIRSSIEVRDFWIDFSNPLDFARSLRATGTATPSADHHPVNLRRVLEQMPDGVRINYRIAFVMLEVLSKNTSRENSP